MSSDIVVSVIIPCFNASKYVDRCVNALEGQTFKRFEVIIVDDCSTDDTFKVLQSKLEDVSFPYQLIELDHNYGPGHARNKGIESAQGLFVSFCDIDDTYDSDFLQKMYYAAVYCSSDIVMCNSVLRLSDGTSRDNSYTQVFHSNETKERYLALSRSSLCYLLVKRELFEDIHLPDLKNGEDIAVVPLIMLKANHIQHIDDRLYNYYVNSDSSSNKPTKNSYNNLLDAFCFLEQNWNEQYYDELEFIGIKTIVYSAMLIGLKVYISPLKLRKTIAAFEQEFKNWTRNKYLHELPKRHQLFVSFIQHRFFLLAFLFSKAHSIILNRR